jgi:hypothetical protein
MKENLERQYHPAGRQQILKILGRQQILKIFQTLAFLGAFTLAPPTTNTNASHQNEARAASKIAARDCRDEVCRTLSQISIRNKLERCPDVKSIVSEPTGETVTFEGQIFQVEESEKCGKVLRAEDKTPYVVHNDLKKTAAFMSARRVIRR